MIDIQTMEWKGPHNSFHMWFLAEIDLLISEKTQVKSGYRMRLLTLGDFGVTAKTIGSWRNSKQADMPKPKIIKGIVNSTGFLAFSINTRRQIILAWIAGGMHAAEPSESLIHLMKLLAEKTPDDFLLKSAQEVLGLYG